MKDLILKKNYKSTRTSIREKKIRKRKQSFTTNVNNEEENQIIKNKNPLKQNFNQIITSSKKILISVTIFKN